MNTPVNDRYRPVKGRLKVLMRCARTGLVLRSEDVNNLVVDAGRALMAESAAEFVTHVAVGTDGTSPLPSDIAPLTDEFLKELDDVQQADTSITCAFTIASDEYNGNVIREFGLMQGDPETLFARRTFADGFTKTSDVVLEGTWTVTF